jgi:hypothetical protein
MFIPVAVPAHFITSDFGLMPGRHWLEAFTLVDQWIWWPTPRG